MATEFCTLALWMQVSSVSEAENVTGRCAVAPARDFYLVREMDKLKRVVRRLICHALAGILLLAIHAPAHAASRNLSFAEAHSLLFERSDAIRAAGENTSAKRETLNSLKTIHGPTISVQAGEIWGETHIDIDRSISTPLGKMPVDIGENKNFNGPRAAITGTLPIFAGGKLVAEQRAGKYSL